MRKEKRYFITMNVCGMMNEFKLKYDSMKWQLYIDLFKVSIKAVLLLHQFFKKIWYLVMNFFFDLDLIIHIFTSFLMMVLFSKFQLSYIKIKGKFVELNIKKLIANILFTKTM